MARPRNNNLKKNIKDRKDAGATLEELCTEFGLSQNTIFYHLRTAGVDRRSRYTQEEKERLAKMTLPQLRQEATKTGKTFLALHRVVLRERRKRQNDLKARLILQDWFDFYNVEHLRFFGYTSKHVDFANKVLAKFGLALEAPNILKHPASGKWQPLVLQDQEDILVSPDAFIRDAAPRLKPNWRVEK